MLNEDVSQTEISVSAIPNDQTPSGILELSSTQLSHTSGSITYNLRAVKPTTVNLTDVIQQLKSHVGMLEIVKTLDLEKRFTMQSTGNSLQGSCPTGHDSKSHLCFSISLNENLYNCFNCGEAGDIVQLVELTEKVGRIEAVRLLIDKCAPELKHYMDEWVQNLSPEEAERYRIAELYNLIFREGKRLLYETVGKPVLDYLVQVRGYDPAKLQSTDWIYWDNESTIRSYLLSQKPGLEEQIKQLHLNGGFGDNLRLGIPFRDRSGMITGFMKRAHAKTGFTIRGTTGVRWDSTKGLTKPDLFGLNRIRNQEELVVVEGYPDAAYLPSLGLENIVACGQAKFSDKYIDGLHAKHIKRLILALDNDGGTGIRNSRDICRLFAETDIDVFVIDPPLMGNSKDPDEYVKANGIDAFRKLIENAVGASSWMTKQILASNNVTSDLGKAKAIDEVLEVACILRNPLEAQAVVDTISKQLGMTTEMLNEYYQQFKQKVAVAQAQKILQGITGAAQKMAKEGNIGPALQKLSAEVDRLSSTYGNAGSEPEIPLSDFLKSKQTTDAKRIPGQRLGYTLTQFPTIDNVMCGLQPSMITLAADPNTGKTILAINLGVDILQSNPGASVVFYSMDDTRDAIVSRFVAKLTALPINDVQRKAKGVAEAKLI